ncbi:MerR family transcriptional regulator [Mycobacteroides abscessus subsp. massiliense]|nr:MerR family transcriptional regulator [Mycobacteroides abscessus subsp. massiliense]SKH74038.1 MerR family transcriptional regulator [Mycobacteroides abscessus subsp. massiliense]SKH96749.1 Transcriptional regulator, MerR family [Mycobacteroides abscessus subsp. massiliense]SKI08544.1 MerR family transcriptional regulator [Mycobacteroides abscessus subsp. massiliense]SKK04795.1 MerR family transcriptional regulator [Mycobacteroides abscessus subsp. massiliense]
MGWSTRELADLAGTSLRTVRHYHDVGLLGEPKRRSNGYKSYGVAHLVRVLQIKRLTGLGLSLKQIAEMDGADENPQEALRALDAELATTIDRLQGVRDELAQIFSSEIAADLPREFGAAVDMNFSETDRSLAFVMSRVLGPSGLQAFVGMFLDQQDRELDHELENLPADADERTRADLAERMSLHAKRLYVDHPGMLNSTADAPRGQRFAESTVARALLDLFNPAQLDVLMRVGAAVRSEPDKG